MDLSRTAIIVPWKGQMDTPQQGQGVDTPEERQIDTPWESQGR